METLIPTINKLQQVFNTVRTDRPQKIELPQIVVIGSQSCGKSSVLESIVGRDFLPRGNGVVTRRPLILQLVNVTEEDAQRVHDDDENIDDWARFHHKHDTIFTDFTEVREEIENETIVTSGTNKKISRDPIFLDIYSTRVVNLTLVDLPGITKVPVGEQPEDIERLTLELCHEYITNPNSIILAVSPANIDLATSESLKLAREVDPEGSRTLAVITKLDLMDLGTDAMDVLCGDVIPVKLGIIGVVNRSQQDIQNNKKMDVALRDEAAYLHAKYRSIAYKNGIQVLARTLSELLVNHIREKLPEVKMKIHNLLVENQATLDSLGAVIADTDGLIRDVISDFARDYRDNIKGGEDMLETTKLLGGARICYVFHEMYRTAMESVDPLGGLTTRELRTAVKNASGPKPPMFIQSEVFELLLQKQIRRLEGPSLICINQVHEEMQRIINNCGTKQVELQRFPLLHERINEVVTSFQTSRLLPTREMVKNLVAIELSYINTEHPDFNPDDKTLDSLAVNHKQIEKKDGEETVHHSLVAAKVDELQILTKDMSPREKVHCEVLGRLIQSYFLVARKNIMDTVPKAIMHFLVKHVKVNLEKELSNKLHRIEHVTNFLRESEHVARRRSDTEEMIETLKKASAIIGELRDGSHVVATNTQERETHLSNHVQQPSSRGNRQQTPNTLIHRAQTLANHVTTPVHGINHVTTPVHGIDQPLHQIPTAVK